MKKEIIATQNAPAAVGPYSQAVKAAPFLFVSGQLPIDPAIGKFAGQGIAEQTRQCLDNLKAVLEAAGSGLAQVVKATVFIKDMNEFDAMNQVFRQYFAEKPPARACVEVARLPRDAKVEIEAIAICGA